MHELFACVQRKKIACLKTEINQYCNHGDGHEHNKINHLQVIPQSGKEMDMQDKYGSGFHGISSDEMQRILERARRERSAALGAMFSRLFAKFGRRQVTKERSDAGLGAPVASA